MPDRLTPSRAVVLRVGLSLALGAWAASTAAAQAATPSPTPGVAPAAEEAASPRDLMSDYLHYVIIRQDELALAAANALLDMGITAEEFVGLVEDSPDLPERFDRATLNALAVPALEDVSAQLRKLYEQGRLDRARNPEEIARNIELLDGTARARGLGRERLMAAKEYAVPQLLEVLLQRARPSLESHVERLLADMAGDAVAPLCAALPGVDEATQVRIVRILGQSGFPAARACLYDLMRSASSAPLLKDCERSITLVQGAEPDPRVSVAELYWDLGEDYYAGSRSLTRFPGEEHQLLWNFEPGIGLFATPIRTEVFNEARAMDLAEKALKADPQHEDAIGLWLAANFRREIDAPEGYDNPVYPADKRGALYYAVMAGSDATEQVLARAIEDRDTPLARRAIEAISLTAGDAGGAPRALIDALTYPDRRVQYDAALAIARSKPTRAFPGSERVTPILAGAVRDASERFALVLAGDPERQQRLNDLAAAKGYTVLFAGRTLMDGSAALAEAPGVDLLLVDLPRGATEELLSSARQTPKLGATPALCLLPIEAYNDLWPRYESDPLTALARQGVSDEQITERIEQLAMRATGPTVGPEEAESYARASLGALRDLTISRNPVLDASAAGLTLVAALEEAAGDVRLQVADVLSRINMKRAQAALVDAALESEGGEQIALLSAATESARSFGNMLEQRQLRDVVELTRSDDGGVATAAAALVGALNLREAQLTPLILGT